MSYCSFHDTFLFCRKFWCRDVLHLSKCHLIHDRCIQTFARGIGRIIQPYLDCLTWIFWPKWLLYFDFYDSFIIWGNLSVSLLDVLLFNMTQNFVHFAITTTLTYSCLFNSFWSCPWCRNRDSNGRYLRSKR